MAAALLSLLANIVVTTVYPFWTKWRQRGEVVVAARSTDEPERKWRSPSLWRPGSAVVRTLRYKKSSDLGMSSPSCP